MDDLIRTIRTTNTILVAISVILTLIYIALLLKFGGKKRWQT